MFLKGLLINSKNGIIRDITFKKGLNLIINETSNVTTESGNSVGKTTLLRAIDYCLGSDGKDVYIGKEFKEINHEVYDFLLKNEVTFKLTLDTKLILDTNNDTIIIERGFVKDSCPKLNGEEFKSLDKFKEELKKVFLKINTPKPTIRQIAPKFIRKDYHSMSNTLKFLHPSTKNDDYEIIYLYLFGFGNQDLLNKRFKLTQKIKELKNRLDVLTKDHSLNTLKQIVNIVSRDIKEIEEKIRDFKLNEVYESELSKLNKIKSEISQLSIDISNLEMKLILNQNTILELKKNFSKVDSNIIKEIYTEAKSFIPDLQKSFEDVLDFHNKMIYKKIEFIEKGLITLQQQIKDKKNALNIKINQEKLLLISLSDKGSLSDLRKLQSKLNELYERKGQEEKLVSMIQESQGEMQDYEDQLNDVSDKISAYFSDLDNKISIFNLCFSDYSKKLYDEEYILSYDIKDKKITFKINTISGNVGSGKKKGQVAAFDLAYISFLKEMNSKLFRFVMHDSIEDIDPNQVKTLFDISNKINGQYVVAVLKDKIDFLGEEFLNENTILRLSQNDKFFRI